MGDFPGCPMVRTPSSGGGAPLIPGQGAKIPHASQPKKKQIIKQYYKKFIKDFKNCPHEKKFLNTHTQNEIQGR